MNRLNWLAAGVAALLMLSCSSQKDPADQAIAKINNQMDAIHDTAAKYSPETLQTVQGQVAALKQSYDKGDYGAVVTGAPAVGKAIADLQQEASAKASEADAALAKVKQQWRNLTYEVPPLVQSLHTQVDSFSKSKTLPRGVTKAGFASAKDGVTSLDAMWTDANNTVSSGDYAGAVTKGQAVKDKATELMHTLGLKAAS